MNISEGLFAFLLFLAVIPAYVFAIYGLYISRMTSSMVGKLLEQDMNAMGAVGGHMGSPAYPATSMSLQDFAKMVNSKAKKGDEEGDAPKPVGGHYL